MADVFISYKSDRRPAAEHLAEILADYGYTVWWDYALVSGRDFGAQIEKQLRASKVVVVLWCSRAVESEWVREEAALAKRLGTLIPTTIEQVELPLGFALAQTIDLSAWDGAPQSHRLDRLLRDVAQLVGRDPFPNREGLERTERAWRRFGAPTLREFALIDELERNLPTRTMPSALAEGAAKVGEPFTYAEDRSRRASETMESRRPLIRDSVLRTPNERPQPGARIHTSPADAIQPLANSLQSATSGTRAPTLSQSFLSDFGWQSLGFIALVCVAIGPLFVAWDAIGSGPSTGMEYLAQFTIENSWWFSLSLALMSRQTRGFAILPALLGGGVFLVHVAGVVIPFWLSIAFAYALSFIAYRKSDLKDRLNINFARSSALICVIVLALVAYMDRTNTLVDYQTRNPIAWAIYATLGGLCVILLARHASNVGYRNWREVLR